MTHKREMDKKQTQWQSENKAKYSNHISPERADELYEQIIRVMFVEKKYRDKTFTAEQLSHVLNTNSRYVSLVIATRFHTNYPNLVNRLRVAEAVNILTDARYKEYAVADVGSLVGFSNRQSFYSAFIKFTGTTPRAYRVANSK